MVMSYLFNANYFLAPIVSVFYKSYPKKVNIFNLKGRKPPLQNTLK